MLGRVLRKYLSKISCISDITLTQQNIEYFASLLQWPESSESRIIQLNKSFHFRLTGKILELLPVGGSAGELLPQIWDYNQTPEIRCGNWLVSCQLLPGAVSRDRRGVFYFDADAMPEKLLCKIRQGGEVMQVWGSSSPRRVKHLLCGAENKENMLLVTDEQHQIYLLGNLRRSIHAPVTEKTVRTLEFRVCRLDQ